jgi:hypothetical protein
VPPTPTSKEETVALPTLPDSQVLVTVGVDTHADSHVAVALDHLGRLLGTRTIPTTPAGYAALLERQANPAPGLGMGHGTVVFGVERRTKLRQACGPVRAVGRSRAPPLREHYAEVCPHACHPLLGCWSLGAVRASRWRGC